MGGFLLLLSIAIVVSFFAFREGKDVSKPISYNSGGFAKNRLLKDKNNFRNFKNNTDKETEDSKPIDPSPTVTSENYVFVSSKKYHRANCRFANTKSDPISIESAKLRKLSPCKICNPHKD